MSLRHLAVQIRTIFSSSFRTRGISVNTTGMFDKVFNKYLLVTNTMTCGCLMGVGDLIQQEIEYRRHMLEKRYSWGRLGRMFLIGLTLGPVTHVFYKYLDHYIPRKNLLAVIKKIMLDQLIMSPVCIAWFFYGMGLSEGKRFNDCTEELNGKFVEVYTIDWSVWPPVQFFNFYFLPVQYQVIYINLVTMFYNVFLSYMKHREDAQSYKATHIRTR